MSAPFQPGDVVVCVDNKPATSMQNPLPPVSLGSVHRVSWCGVTTDADDGRLRCGVNLDEGIACIWTRPAEWFRRIDGEVTEDFRSMLRTLGNPKEVEA